jgi:hypothetical protein
LAYATETKYCKDSETGTMLCTKEEKELQKSSIKKRLNTAKLQSINYITGKKKVMH